MIKAVLTANWAMCLETLDRMSPSQACVVCDEGAQTGRTALHMAVWVKPKETSVEVYQEFLEKLAYKAPCTETVCE